MGDIVPAVKPNIIIERFVVFVAFAVKAPAIQQTDFCRLPNINFSVGDDMDINSGLYGILYDSGIAADFSNISNKYNLSIRVADSVNPLDCPCILHKMFSFCL